MITTGFDPDTDAMFVWFGPEGTSSAATLALCSTSTAIAA
jgi:hypothetical protein